MNCILKYALKKCTKKNITDIKVIDRYLKMHYNISLSEEALCLRLNQKQKIN